MSAKKQPIIIKKVKKGHGGHHGGAWKVAYADFVTAMMAFFLLMWLLNMSSQEQRVRLAQYYKTFSIFEKGGTSMMSASAPSMDVMEQKRETSDPSSGARGQTGGSKVGVYDPSTVKAEKAVKDIQVTVKAKLGEELSRQIIIDRVEGGIRIQLMDGEGRSMFELGSALPRPITKDILGIIATSISDLPNKIVVEGHTDAYGSQNAKSSYSNWELSADRANAARKLLVQQGVDAKRISRVAGYADTENVIPDVPIDPRNRRVSIILLDQRLGASRAVDLSPPRSGSAGNDH
jgi:chemotaxis protein MotB